MKKRLLISCLAVICSMIFLWMLPADAATVSSGSWGGDTRWTLSDDGTLTITGTRHMEGDTYNIFPWTEYADQVKKLVLKDGHTTIACERARYIPAFL